MVMGQGFHRGFTAAEKTELWDRWKRGESLKAIGRAFGKPSSSIHFLVAKKRYQSSLPPRSFPSRPPSLTARRSSGHIVARRRIVRGRHSDR